MLQEIGYLMRSERQRVRKRNMKFLMRSVSGRIAVECRVLRLIGLDGVVQSVYRIRAAIFRQFFLCILHDVVQDTAESCRDIYCNKEDLSERCNVRSLYALTFEEHMCIPVSFYPTP